MEFFFNDRVYRIVSTLAVAVSIFAGQTANADFVFGTAENLGPAINSPLQDAGATISLDALSLCFTRHVNWNENEDYWLTTRTTKDAPWDTPVNFGEWDDSLWSVLPVWQGLITGDGLELYFSDHEDRRPGGYGTLDLWMMKRETKDSEWGPPVNLGPTVNTKYEEMWPVISRDGLELHFSGYGTTNARPGGQGGSDLWVTRRATRDDPWEEPVNLGSLVNSSSGDGRPMISADGLWMFFDSSRPGGYGSRDLYFTRRQTLSDAWTEPVNLGPTVNSPEYEECAHLSPDGSTLYFDTGRAGGNGGHDIWQASVIPIVDFNGDGRVDASDAVRMTESWGTEDTLCDIGPTPFGDGIVDVQDLTVLSDYFFEEVEDPMLMAHWALDETDGATALDSAGGDDAHVLGDPTWEPTGGRVGGALQLDGMDDFVASTLVVDPADGPFSVLAWIKGGSPGQVIIAQQVTADWLMLDTEGKLATDIVCEGRSALGPLSSEMVVADRQWHRIGLVWDGSFRTLYVDGIVVAEDMPTALRGSKRGLYIGVGADLSVHSFFSGLIDDVRIYNRVIRP